MRCIRYTVKATGKTVSLTESESVVLNRLAAQYGQPVSAASLHTALVESGEFGARFGVIKVHICNIRKKMRAANNGIAPIQTIYDTASYMLNA